MTIEKERKRPYSDRLENGPRLWEVLIELRERETAKGPSSATEVWL